MFGWGVKHTQVGRLDTGYIDGLRGLSAAWVVVAHCMIWGDYRGWIPNPKMAVDVFMVISGYLIALTYKPPEGALAFYVRRAFRLLPVYYLALTMAFMVFGAFGHGYERLQELNPQRWAHSLHRPGDYVADLQSYVAHLSMLFGLLPKYSIGSMLPDWSLTLEWQFYLTFPILLGLLLRKPILMSSLLFSIAVLAWPISGFPEPSLLLLKLPVFLIGVFCCFYHVTRRFQYLAVSILLFVGHLILSYEVLYGRQSLILGVLVSVFFLDRGPWRVARRCLGGGVFRFMANTSYSAYLTHGFFIAFVGSWIMSSATMDNRPTHLSLMIAAVFVGTYVVSALLFSFVERPMTLRGKRAARRFEPEAQHGLGPAA